MLSQIQAMWYSGAITADAVYWYKGLTDWKNIADLAEPPEPPEPPTDRKEEKKRKADDRVRYNEKNDTFVGPLSAIMRLAVKAIQRQGHKIDNANESLGILTFQTSTTLGSWTGMVCSLGFEEVGENAYHINVSGKSAGFMGFDLLDEAKPKARKVVKLMAELAD